MHLSNILIAIVVVIFCKYIYLPMWQWCLAVAKIQYEIDIKNGNDDETYPPWIVAVLWVSANFVAICWLSEEYLKNMS